MATDCSFVGFFSLRHKAMENDYCVTLVDGEACPAGYSPMGKLVQHKSIKNIIQIPTFQAHSFR